MNNNLWEMAEKLAARQYAITMEEDTLSNGQVVFLVKHPELPGCKAQGTTINEAKENLDAARVDYIHALLEDGLEVPIPAAYTPITESISDTQVWVFDASIPEDDIESAVGRVVHTQHKTSPVGVSLQGDFVEHG